MKMRNEARIQDIEIILDVKQREWKSEISMEVNVQVLLTVALVKNE